MYLFKLSKLAKLGWSLTVMTALVPAASAHAEDFCSAPRQPSGPFDISFEATQVEGHCVDLGGALWEAYTHAVEQTLTTAQAQGIDPAIVWAQSSKTVQAAVFSFGELTDFIYGFEGLDPQNTLLPYVRAVARQSGAMFTTLTFDQEPQQSLRLWLIYSWWESQLGNTAASAFMSGPVNAHLVFQTLLAGKDPFTMVAEIGQGLVNVPVAPSVAAFVTNLVMGDALPVLQTLGQAHDTADTTQFGDGYVKIVELVRSYPARAAQATQLVDFFVEGARRAFPTHAVLLVWGDMVALAVPTLDQAHIDLIADSLGAITHVDDPLNLRVLLNAMEARVGLTDALRHAEQVLAASD
jgi:hypothetical protein